MVSNTMSVSSAKYEVPKFDGGTSFSLWKIRMKSTLTLQGLWQAVMEKFDEDSDESKKADLKERALSAIFISVTNNVCNAPGPAPPGPTKAESFRAEPGSYWHHFKEQLR